MKPKILFLDIETAPLQGYAWSLWKNDIALNQLKTDWHVLSWAAKWSDSTKVLYQDQRNAEEVENDRDILESVWELIDQADILVTQNGKSFDLKKLNARFIMHGFKPPSTVRHIDTKILAKRHFAFTSNRLEYLTDKLCTKYKKLKHKKFPGFELWKECLKGNLEAWKEMEKYNKHDVLSLEELYEKLIAWDGSINFNVYDESLATTCSCGSKKFEKRGWSYTNDGKYQRYRCLKCGAWSRSKENALSDVKRGRLRPKA